FADAGGDPGGVPEARRAPAPGRDLGGGPEGEVIPPFRGEPQATRETILMSASHEGRATPVRRRRQTPAADALDLPHQRRRRYRRRWPGTDRRRPAAPRPPRLPHPRP